MDTFLPFCRPKSFSLDTRESLGLWKLLVAAEDMVYFPFIGFWGADIGLEGTEFGIELKD